MKADDLRRMAMMMEGAIEGAHMNHPDFRVHGRIFATIQPGGKTGMVKLTPDQQREAVERHPDAFMPESGAWGRAGCTRVQFDTVTEEQLGEALTMAWQNGVSAAASRKHAPAASPHKKARPQRRATADRGRRAPAGTRRRS
jgi:hypothetical protein